MSSLKKACHECGMPLSMGLANCLHCGATVGTVFSETSAPAGAGKGKRQSVLKDHVAYYDRIEKAKERANNSVILALTSFFPLIGFIMGVAAVVLALMAARTLKTENVEDGQGSATAGLIIGLLGFVAQGGYIVYVLKAGNPFG